MINRGNVSTGIAWALVFLVVFSGICFVSEAQTDTSFTPTDTFPIPANNSTINFATNRRNSTIAGTYTSATLENNVWNFVGLHLNNSQSPEKLTLKVSAQDSKVTIRSYEQPNSLTTRLRLRYNVTGRGTQTFNFGFVPTGGEWDIVFNGDSKAPNDGWSISPDATITITGATANVSITYYRLPDDYVALATQPFYQQHSVLIIAAVAFAITVILAVAIRIKIGDPEEGELLNKNSKAAKT